jgi:hypothetical protein
MDASPDEQLRLTAIERLHLTDHVYDLPTAADLSLLVM